ncbi:hypothetical protein TKK_0013784 [Trichogramma kaykai]
MGHKKKKQLEIENPVEELQRLMKKVESINKHKNSENVPPNDQGDRRDRDSITSDLDKVKGADDEDEDEEIDDWSLVVRNPKNLSNDEGVIDLRPGGVI